MKLTQAQLKEVLEYDEATGIFRWKVNKSKRSKVGMKAGSKNKKVYTNIFINGKAYKARVLAWLYVYGKYPSSRLKSESDIKSDNRIGLLFEASDGEIARSSKVNKSSESGVKGVTYRKDHSKWAVQISVNSKRIYIGEYTNIEDAKKERIKAELKYKY
ncbi:MAG: HNH endonuclease [Alteromonadales bacterium]|nr:HNH endonuclease [Alteromonadales bacterium]